MASASSSHGERRQVTVVFSDVVGSSELSAQLDPEDWHSILSRYHQTAASVVKRFEGHVQQYLGDGILILFGYPQARENDAERAVRAGLSLLEEIQKLNVVLEKEFSKRIAARIGIHTGEVMIRQEGGDSGNIFGETPNLAARVQTAAEPDSVCISAATQRLVAGFFVVDDLGPHILKGFPDPIQLFKVERPSGVRSRLHAAAVNSLTPFMGREDERNLLMSRWAQVQKGHGQLVMITGEAGIGKSRLLRQFKQDVGAIPHTWIEGESSPYEQDTPFAPTIDLIENAFEWTAEATADKKIADLENSFSLTGMDTTKSVPLVATLLGIVIPPGKYPPILLSPEQQRAHLLQALVDWVIGSSRSQPTILVVEDLHFSDPSTLEEFVMLGEQVEHSSVMLLFTARPRFIPPWPTRPFHSLITLSRLDQENVREMIGNLLGALVPPDILQSLADRTDGNPLFAEELSQSMAGARSIADKASQIPSTLQDLLMARLDFLGTHKEIAQIGSVLGRAFPYSLLSAIAGQPEETLQNELEQLIASGLVFRDESSGDVIYTFKHALVQEAAYGSLLKSRRRELHRAVSIALNEKFPEVAKQRPELVAHHLTEAGDTEKAIEAWQTAGDFAHARAAIAEAHHHFNKAISLLQTLPDTPERAQLELPLVLSMGNIYAMIKGLGSAEAVQAYQRAREIATQLGDSPQFFFILIGLWSTVNTHSDMKASQELVDELLRIAERDSIPMYLTWAYFAKALTDYELGHFSEVGESIEKMLKNYKAEEHTWAPFDPKVTSLNHAALALWHSGRIDQARKTLGENLESARALNSPPNMAMAHLAGCSLFIYLRDPQALLEHAEAMLAAATENQLPSFLAWGTMYRGIAHASLHNVEEGVAEINKGLADYLASGTHSSLGQYLSKLAEAHARAGNLEKAHQTIEDAFGAAPEEEMHFPELHRVRADIRLLQPHPDLETAEQGYRDAIAASQKYQSLTQELRAVTRLGRLLQSCGRSREARTLLAPLYAKFTEGLDTPDLVEAKKLLDELNG
ncbi:MAG TPA: adenylate/guanylate cyclase domain-containing protein [Anaerolineales bacterium]|jgi:class 3 adenylate cyclase/tetratricopeptide (TPR) repeat protein|nr:adenylate/guanylate cyclase domain-containing protein [Anaerolineales bacterium]